MANEHSFCRQHLKRVMSYVKDNVDSAIIKRAWAYKYDGERIAEFHIEKCPELPKSFYWSGRGCCKWSALAEGWESFLKEHHNVKVNETL